MSANKYTNFIKAASSSSSCLSAEARNLQIPSLIGEEAKRIYLEEVNDARPVPSLGSPRGEKIKCNLKGKEKIQPSNKELFLAAERNDVVTIKQALQESPQKVNLLDDYGWSLLMIACQGNSVETVKELLDLGADTSVRDKAGNSAQNLVIKSKNMHTKELLLNNITREEKQKPKGNHKKQKLKEDFVCKTCNAKFPNKLQHICSTLHNMNVSKGKKLPTCYKIPESNKGYQIMLRGGWDRDSGLGSEGTGIKYPIKLMQKKDRKGLGHDKMKNTEEDTSKLVKNRKELNREYLRNRQREIDFRREFY